MSVHTVRTAPAVGIAERAALWWWFRLPLAVARWLPTLGSGLSDGIYLFRWPSAAAAAPPLALLAGLLLGALYPVEIYSGSSLVMALLIGIGILSAQLGMWALLGYAVGHLFLGDYTGRRELLESLLLVQLPLIISYVVLMLPVVIVPLILTSLRLQLRQFPLPVRARALVEGLSYLVLGALLVYFWSQAAAVLIRPVYTWQGGQPSAAVIFPLQERAWILSLAVSLTGLLRLLLEVRANGPRVVGLAQLLSGALAQVTQKRRQRRLNRWAGLLLSTAALTLLMAGMISSWVDGILLFLFLLGVFWARRRLQEASWQWLDLVKRVPLLLRFVLGVGIGYLLSSALLSVLWYQTQTFRPVLLATTLSVAIITLLTAPVRAPEQAAVVPGAKG